MSILDMEGTARQEGGLHRFDYFTPFKHDFGRVPKEAEDCIARIVIHILYMVGVETAKYFGEDSMAATYESASFLDFTTDIDGPAKFAAACVDPDERTYIRTDETIKAKKEYVESMKELLKWAGIDGVRDDVLEAESYPTEYISLDSRQTMNGSILQ